MEVKMTKHPGAQRIHIRLNLYPIIGKDLYKLVCYVSKEVRSHFNEMRVSADVSNTQGTPIKPETV